MAKKNTIVKIIIAISAIILCCGIGYLLVIHVPGWIPSDHLKISIQKEGSTLINNGKLKETSDVYLYFADAKGLFLKAEKRVIPQSEDPTDMGKAIIEELIKGPIGDLVRTIPQGTSLNAIYVSHDGTTFVDFSEALREKHPGGSQTELLTVYSIVNSLALNIPEVDRVKILINGHEAMTLAGHIDLRFPFQENMILVR